MNIFEKLGYIVFIRFINMFIISCIFVDTFLKMIEKNIRILHLNINNFLL